jgi:HSP20 family protein
MARPAISTRRLPFSMDNWASDMEKVFEQFFQLPANRNSGGNGRFMPTLDISETESGFEIHCDLPGVKPEDVKLELHDDRLSISGHRRSQEEQKEKNFHRIERTFGEFYRTVQLPGGLDADQVDATYEDGVLTVRVPKSVKLQPKKIQVRSAQPNS